MLLSPAEQVLLLLGCGATSSSLGTRCCVRAGAKTGLHSSPPKLGCSWPGWDMPCASCCRSWASFRTFVLGMSELHFVNRTAASRESSPGVGKSLLRAHH